MENETMRLVLAFQSTLPAWGATLNHGNHPVLR